MLSYLTTDVTSPCPKCGFPASSTLKTAEAKRGGLRRRFANLLFFCRSCSEEFTDWRTDWMEALAFSSDLTPEMCKSLPETHPIRVLTETQARAAKEV